MPWWALAAGAAASLLGPWPGMAAAAVAGAWPGRRRLGVVALAGVLVGSHQLAALAADPLRGDHGPFTGRAIVQEPWRGGLVTARALGAIPGGGPVMIRIAARAPRPPRGAVLAVTGSIGAPRPAFHGFDERTWLARQGVHAVLSAHALRVVGHRGGVWGVFDRIRELALRSYAGAGSDDAGLALGSVALGADDRLSPSAHTAFQRSGLAHLLAVSGGNIVVLAGFVLWAAWVCGLGRAVAQAGVIVATVAYVAVVGPSPSVVRAGITGVLAAGAWLLSRPADAWHAYWLAAAVLLCRNPYALLDPGFQLSFAAVAAILVVAPRFRTALEGVPFPDALRGAAAISAACTLATAPISYLHFGRVNLIAAVPANLAALPAVPVLLLAGLTAAALAPVAPGAAAAVSATARPAGLYLMDVARAGAWLDARTTALETPAVAAMAVAGVVLVIRARPVQSLAGWLRATSNRST
jgi:competence protein ComEC